MKIVKINKDLEDLVLAKIDVEETLKKEDPEYEKKSIEEFIKWLALYEHIFVYKNETSDTNVLPFTLWSKDNKDYIFTVTELPDAIDRLLTRLKEIKYNFRFLEQVGPVEVVNGILNDKNSYFVIKNVMYI